MIQYIRCGKKFVAFFPLDGIKKTPRTFILIDKKIIAVFTDRCLLKKHNYFLANPIDITYNPIDILYKVLFEILLKYRLNILCNIYNKYK